MATKPFHYQEMFPLGPDTTEYKLITKDYVKVENWNGHEMLVVDPEALTVLANVASHNCSFMLRREHNELVAKILNDPEASENDKYVALTMLRNAEVAAKGVLPFCQDTGTSICSGYKGQQVWTGCDDEEKISEGVYKTYTENNLRYSQNAPLNMYDEVNTGCNLPAQIEIHACDPDEIIRASGKTGMGVDEILRAIVERVPAPKGDPKAPLQALIFDSVFNPFRGIIAYYKIVNGTIKTGDFVKFVSTGKEYDADEIGVLKLEMSPRKELSAGNVGYIISGIKNSKEVKVGDTITHVANPCKEAIAGFEEVKPMVFAGVYPIETEDFENLRAALEKLQLNDASLTFQPESSAALGFGFRCGFLGLLHMEIVQERLGREFDMDVITTVPNVSYKVYDKKGNCIEVHNPSGLPEPTLIDHIEEPYIRATIITQADYIGPIMTLCLGKRGELIKQEYISGNRMELTFDIPLGEIVIDFYDKLKSISKGYASFDYHIHDFRASKLVKMDILLNGESVDALSTLTHEANAVRFGRRMCEKLKELIPRQQFDIAIQAAIGAKIIARETIKAVRKDVTAKCYGGDISRKRKLLEKQKAGKKRMKQIGSVEVPQKAFLAVLKLD